MQKLRKANGVKKGGHHVMGPPDFKVGVGAAPLLVRIASTACNCSCFGEIPMFRQKSSIIKWKAGEGRKYWKETVSIIVFTVCLQFGEGPGDLSAWGVVGWP